MIPREIAGPQAQYERRGQEALRDVRPLSVRLSLALRSRASSAVLAGMAGVTLAVPALADAAALAGVLYAFWVVTGRPDAPIRLPISARRRDWSDPDPETRRPRMAAGEALVGWEEGTNKEIWLNNEDLRQHGTLPGTTGSGKTTAILSSLTNPLSQGSGYILVDGKANAELYGQAYVQARRLGREDDLRVLNLLTASLPPQAVAHGYNPFKQTATFNPFATGNADALKELLASQLGEAPANDSNGVFRERAVALIGSLAPVLVWMRDHKGISVNIEKIRFMVELKSIWMLATQKIFVVRDPASNDVAEIHVPDIPTDVVYPLQAYLGEIPGYDTSLPYNEQKTEKPLEQHGYAIFYFTGTFTQLAVSLGHVFKVETGDIEMRDVVMNRRLLIVNLPALQGSDETLAALGRIVIASLRAMMAQLLGAKLEGDPREIFAHKPGMGVGSFWVDFDELGYYATSGMDRMFAMGRGINMAFRIAFQELGGIWARLGEKTYSLLGNANLTIGMRQQDSGRTREWLEKTAGQSWVTQATSYVGGVDGAYREAHNADLRQVNRVEWQDFQRLLPGEAVLLFGGRRVYARLFHARFEITGRPRLNRPLMLAACSRQDADAPARRVAGLRDKAEQGLLSDLPDAPLGPVLGAMAAAFAALAGQGAAMPACVAAAIEAAGRVAAANAASRRPGGPALAAASRHEAGPAPDAPGRQPITVFTPMLDIATERPAVEPGRSGRPMQPVDAELLATFCAIERAAGAPRAAAQASALAALAERDRALAALEQPDAVGTADPALCETIQRLIAAFESGQRPAAGAALPQAAE